MIEQAVIFALGFLVAGLLALAFAPAFWRRAYRLTRRRLEMQMPLSAQEILAERDQLRAEFAVERCRLDQRAEELTYRHTADLAELGRRAAEIATLRTDLAAGAVALQQAEDAHMDIAQELTGLEAEVGALRKALYDSEGLRQRKEAEFVDYVNWQESTKVLTEMRLTALSTADARASDLELRIGDLSRNLLEAERKLIDKDLHARSLAEAVARLRGELESAQGTVAQAQQRSETHGHRSLQLQDALASLQQRHDATLAELKSLTVKLTVKEAALEDARRRAAEFSTKSEHHALPNGEGERALSDKYRQLRSEHAALESALEAARRRCEELESASTIRQGDDSVRPNGAASAEDHAQLRQSISDLGAAIVQLMRPNGASEPVAPRPTPRLPRASLPNLMARDAQETRTGNTEPANT